MASGIYNSWRPKGLTPTAAHTLKCALLTASHSFDATNSTWADISANEITGATAVGYTAGGVTLGTVTITTTVANSWGVQWAAGTAYALGKIVRPTTGNGFVYRAVVAGSSHATTQPTWPTTIGLTVVDQGVTWQCAGTTVSVLTSATPAWAASTITARFAVVYDTSDSNQLVSCYDFGLNVTATNGVFAAAFASEGIVDLTA